MGCASFVLSFIESPSMNTKNLLRSGLLLLSAAFLLSGCAVYPPEAVKIENANNRLLPPMERSKVPGENSFRMARINLKNRRIDLASRNAVTAFQFNYGPAEDMASDLIFVQTVVPVIEGIRLTPDLLYHPGELPFRELIQSAWKLPLPKLQNRFDRMPAVGANEGLLKAAHYLFREYRDAEGDLAEQHADLRDSPFTVKERPLAKNRKPVLEETDIDIILRGGPFFPTALEGIRDPKERLERCLANYGYMIAASQFEIDLRLLNMEKNKDRDALLAEAKEVQKHADTWCDICNAIAQEVDNPRRRTAGKKLRPAEPVPKPEERDWLNMEPLEFMRVE